MWEEKLAKGMPVTLKKGEFRASGGMIRDRYGKHRGRRWRRGTGGRRRVPARKYTEHPETREACAAPEKQGACHRPEGAANRVW